MARRFQRDNFLFPQDLRQNELMPAAKPVDPYVQASKGAVIEAPKDPFPVPRPAEDNWFLQMASALAEVEPQLNQYLNKQYEDYTVRAEAAGAMLANEQKQKQSWRQLVSKARKDGGDEAANELLGMNPFVKKGYEETYVRGAALDYSTALQEEYNKNPEVDDMKGGKVRLHDVDLGSGVYQNWLNSFTSSFSEARGLTESNPEIVSKTFLPYAQQEQAGLTEEHDKLRRDRRLLQYTDGVAQVTTKTILSTLLADKEFMAGRRREALADAGAIITKELDQAVALGFGGEDLKAAYTKVAQAIINSALQNKNTDILDLLENIEVGQVVPGKPRAKLYEVFPEFEGEAVQTANRIVDMKREDERWQFTKSEQTRNLKLRELQNKLYALQADKTRAEESSDPTAALKFREGVSGLLKEAQDSGLYAEFLETLKGVKDTVDTAFGNATRDEVFIANLYSRISDNSLSGPDAFRAINQALSDGKFGRGAQALQTHNALTQQAGIKKDDMNGNIARKIAAMEEPAIRAAALNMGVVIDAQNMATSLFQLLTRSNISIEAFKKADRNTQIKTLISLGVPENIVGMVDTTNVKAPTAMDANIQVELSNRFRTAAWNEVMEFQKKNGRLPDINELDRVLIPVQESFLNAVAIQSNSIEYTTNPLTTNRANEAQFDEVFKDLPDDLRGFDVYKNQVLDSYAISKAMEYFWKTGQKSFPRKIVNMARSVGMNPGQFLLRQADLAGADVHPDLRSALGGFDLSGVSGTYRPGAPTKPAPNRSSSKKVSSNVASRVGVGTDAFTGGQRQYTSYLPMDYQVQNAANYEYRFHHNKKPSRYDLNLAQGGNPYVNVPSPVDGVIVDYGTERDASGRMVGWGNYVRIKDTRTGIIWLFGHLYTDTPYLKVGQRVRKGQPFAKQGSTGRSTGPHVHLEFFSKGWQRIENPKITTPMVDEYVRFMQRGEFIAR